MSKLYLIFIISQTYSSGEKLYIISPIEVSAKYPESFITSKGTSYMIDSTLLSTFKFDPYLLNLSYSPSLFINTYGLPGYLQTAFFRGFSSTRTGVYLEGFKLNSRTSGSFNLSLLSGLPFSKVEILSSSCSSLYGENALGGVMNFKLERKKGLGIKGGAGNLRTTFFSGIANLDYSHFYYTTYTSIPPIPYLRNKDSHLSRFANLFEHKNFKSILFYSRNNIGNPTNDTTRENDEVVLTGINFRNQYLNLGYQYKKDNIELIFSNLKSKQWNVSNRFTGDVFLGTTNLKLRAGFEYEREYLKGNGFENTNPKDERFYPYFALELVLNQIIPYFEGGKEIGGAHEREGPFVYRGGLLIFSEEGSIYFNYSRGFRAPTLLDLYYPFYGSTKGNPDLKPEISEEIEGGLKALSNNLLFILSYFRRKLEKGIIWAPDENFIFTPQNVEKVKVQGLESLLSYKLQNFLVSINFMLFRERKKIEKDKAENLMFVPTYTLTLLTGYSLKDLTINYRVRFLGPHTSLTPLLTREEIKSIYLNDLSFYYELNKNLSISLIVTNVDNKCYVIQIGYPPERRRVHAFVESNF
ncbi:MAG: TonB-dependent receptor [Candidatus Hydrothermales bacterium]